MKVGDFVKMCNYIYPIKLSPLLKPWIVKPEVKSEVSIGDHFEYDGYRLPSAGEWYLRLGDMDIGDMGIAEIGRSSINFINVKHHIYRLVSSTKCPVMGFDEWW